MTLAGIPNARLVVVADLDPVEAETRPRARARRPGHDRRARRDQRPGGRGRRHRHPDVDPRDAHRGRAPGGQGDLEREADRPRPGRDRAGRRALARDGHPGPDGVHAPLRPGLRPGQGADRCRRARADRAVPGLLARHVPAAGQVHPRQRRLVPRHERPRLRSRALPRGRGRGGVRVGQQPHRPALRGRRRRRHGGDDAALPERRPGRRRDVAPLGLGLRHPDRGGGRPRQGRRRCAAQDRADVVAAVRLRGRPLRELPGPVRGRLPARVRRVLPDAGRGRDPVARARTMRSRRSGSRWRPSAAGSRVVRSACDEIRA